MNYYPDRIADDDYDGENSRGSAEIEGGAGPMQDPKHTAGSGPLHMEQRGEQSSGKAANGNVDGSAAVSSEDYVPSLRSPAQASSKPWHKEGDFRDSLMIDRLEISRHAGRNTTPDDEKAQIHNQREMLIQNERNRRLGTVGGDSSCKNSPTPSAGSSCEPAGNHAGGVLGNIRGWLGGRGGGAGSNAQMNGSPRRSSVPIIQTPEGSSNQLRTHVSMGDENFPPALPLTKNISNNTGGGDDDGASSSSDESSDDDSDTESESSNSSNKDTYLSLQERARGRALQYLSNSCVDSGRRAKTASYIRGLERLDLKRKRDRYQQELEIVESEMNKDRGMVNGGVTDPISALASKLVREVPRIQGADAGAGSGEQSYMLYEEYAVLMVAEDVSKQPPSIWENEEATAVYLTSLQRRLKDALSRTKSLEKRLVVLEKAGDDIVSSLCEDLVEVTRHSNKLEAKYVKKGKGMQRRRRREELRHRGRIKEAERRVRELEEQLMKASGGDSGQMDNLLRSSESSNDSSLELLEEDDAEDDEILLEKKLSSIKAKDEQDKEEHVSEVESIRRSCEQLKLRLSVARLVMEGDDNLREYVALLDRFNPSSQHKRKSGIDVDYDNQEDTFGHMDAVHSFAPPRVNRARAKLLKVTLHERIYEQRLGVSKAFTDATINALEQELCEREEATQKMEVRCLNELMLIDSGIKEIVNEADEKMERLKKEAQDLADAIAACSAEKSIADINGMFAAINASIMPMQFDHPVDLNDSSSEIDSDGDAEQQEEDNDEGEVEPGPDSLLAENGLTDKCLQPAENGDQANGLQSHGLDGENEATEAALAKGVSFSDEHSESDGDAIVETPVAKSKPIEPQDDVDIRMLGRDLESTLDAYQTLPDQSSSDRIEKLELMNDLVLKIARAHGIECTTPEPNESQLKSWSLKKSRKSSADKERREKKRSKKKKKRRRRGKKRKEEKAKDEPDALDSSSMENSFLW